MPAMESGLGCRRVAVEVLEAQKADPVAADRLATAAQEMLQQLGQGTALLCVIMFFLWICVIFAVMAAWLAILFTARYPGGLFHCMVGVTRWSLRVTAYGTLPMTDSYP